MKGEDEDETILVKRVKYNRNRATGSSTLSCILAAEGARRTPEDGEPPYESLGQLVVHRRLTVDVRFMRKCRLLSQMLNIIG
jgi:hypothetical protein